MGCHGNFARRLREVASSWIERRSSADGVRYRVRFRVGGRESRRQYGGSFATIREARSRRAWIEGELAAMRFPDLSALVEPEPAPLLRDVAKRWQASRVDVRETTLVQHRVALGRVLPVLGDRRLDVLTWADVQDLVSRFDSAGKARESIRKSRTALAMVLDFAGISPNVARDPRIKLPREEPEAMEPPLADHVEAVAHLLTVPYMVALLILDAAGPRVSELEKATIGDLDETRKAWLVRAEFSKTRQPRWVTLDDDMFEVIVDRLPPREDRDLSAPLFAGVTGDRLRTAVGRACRDAGVPHFAPHALRHRRISLWHLQGVPWAVVGERVGQRNLAVTANTYTHALIDPRQVDRGKLLVRVRDARAVTPSVTPGAPENPPVCSLVWAQYRPSQ